MPLFGDKFSGIPEEDRKLYVKVYDFDGKDYILKKAA